MGVGVKVDVRAAVAGVEAEPGAPFVGIIVTVVGIMRIIWVDSDALIRSFVSVCAMTHSKRDGHAHTFGHLLLPANRQSPLRWLRPER